MTTVFAVPWASRSSRFRRPSAGFPDSTMQKRSGLGGRKEARSGHVWWGERGVPSAGGGCPSTQVRHSPNDRVRVIPKMSKNIHCISESSFRNSCMGLAEIWTSWGLGENWGSSWGNRGKVGDLTLEECARRKCAFRTPSRSPKAPSPDSSGGVRQDADSDEGLHAQGRHHNGSAPSPGNGTNVVRKPLAQAREFWAVRSTTLVQILFPSRIGGHRPERGRAMGRAQMEDIARNMVSPVPRGLRQVPPRARQVAVDVADAMPADWSEGEGHFRVHF